MMMNSKAMASITRAVVSVTVTSHSRTSAISVVESAEGTDAVDHADHRGNAQREQQHRSDECQGHRVRTLAVNQSCGLHAGPLVTQAEHELDVIDDAAGQHGDAEQHQHLAEIA